MLRAMGDTSTNADDRHRAAARLLHDLGKPMRVLAALGWEGRLREEFLATGAERLPEPRYAAFDAQRVVDGVAEVRRLLRPGAVVDDWLDAGDTIIALGQYRGTFRATGRSTTAAFAHVYRLSAGRIVRFQQYTDTLKVAEAMGRMP